MSLGKSYPEIVKKITELTAKNIVEWIPRANFDSSKIARNLTINDKEFTSEFNNLKLSLVERYSGKATLYIMYDTVTARFTFPDIPEVDELLIIVKRQVTGLDGLVEALWSFE